ncbi:MAG: thioesterase family protein [Bacteroidales bacterium]|jgi:acyl-CoA thioester hydrolase|nr:thioesterase family protein [Bacteroidales bacterium]
MKEFIVENYHFNTPIQIRMSDLDPFAHVNNGTQCHYFDVGRSSYLEHVLQEKVDWQTIQLVLVHLEIDFLRPISYENKIICQTKVYEIGTRSLKMIQQIEDVNTSEIKTVCKSILSGFDRETLSSSPLDAGQIARLKLFESL